MIKRRPLQLHRETLVRLDDRQLTQAAAGRASDKDPQPLSAGPSWCGQVCAN